MGVLRQVELVASWKKFINDACDKYLRDFLNDELMLVAMWLDARNMCGKNVNKDTRAAAAIAVKRRINQKLEEARADMRAQQSHDAHDDDEDKDDGDGMAHLREIGCYEFEQQRKRSAPAIERELKSVDLEFTDLNTALMAASKDIVSEDDFDPLSVFKKNDLPYARAIAFDVFCVPVGEAPAERIFSLVGRMMTCERSRMSDETLIKACFVNKNITALGLRFN